MKLNREHLDQLETDKLIDFFYEQLNLKKEDANALKFTNALIQFTEEQLTRQLIELLITKGFAKISKRTDVMESLIRDLDLTKKINIINNIDATRYKSMISFLRNMNDLRNKVFHAKFSELKYNGKNISAIKTQRDMIYDYIMACKL